MVDFEFDLEEILDKNPYWLYMMLASLAMICLGFGFYSHFQNLIEVYEAQLKIVKIYSYDWNENIPLNQLVFEYVKRLEDFQRDPKVKEVIGLTYNTQVLPIVQGVSNVFLSNESMTKENVVNTAKLVVKVLDPIVKGYAGENVETVNIEYKLEDAKKSSLVWILGAIGLFFFLIGLYYGLKV